MPAGTAPVTTRRMSTSLRDAEIVASVALRTWLYDYDPEESSEVSQEASFRN